MVEQTKPKGPDPRPGVVTRAAATGEGPSAVAQALWETLGEGAEALFFFASADHDLGAVGRALEGHYPDSHVFGCTTSGEVGPDGYGKGSVTAFALPRGHFSVAHEVIRPLSGLDIQEGRAIIQRLHDQIERRAVAAHPARTFAFLMVDGMSRREELLLSAVQGQLGGIPLFGGSAGDDLHFQNTAIFHDSLAHEDCALFAFINTDCPFHVFSAQHYDPTDRKMVITKADTDARTVTEINGAPAASEFARLIGLAREDLTINTFAVNPVMVKVGGDYYVRAIQLADKDESLRFFCAIDEGVVLTLARPRDIVEDLSLTMEVLRQRVGDPQVIIGCDCVFRKVEIDQNPETEPRIAALLKANRVVGFGTYGEQVSGMHMNQTFTGVAIGWPPDAAAPRSKPETGEDP